MGTVKKKKPEAATATSRHSASSAGKKNKEKKKKVKTQARSVTKSKEATKPEVSGPNHKGKEKQKARTTVPEGVTSPKIKQEEKSSTLTVGMSSESDSELEDSNMTGLEYGSSYQTRPVEIHVGRPPKIFYVHESLLKENANRVFKIGNQGKPPAEFNNADPKARLILQNENPQHFGLLIDHLYDKPLTIGIVGFKDSKFEEKIRMAVILFTLANRYECSMFAIEIIRQFENVFYSFEGQASEIGMSTFFSIMRKMLEATKPNFKLSNAIVKTKLSLSPNGDSLIAEIMPKADKEAFAELASRSKDLGRQLTLAALELSRRTRDGYETEED